MKKRWRVQAGSVGAVNDLQELNDLLLRIRGIKKEEEEAFLQPRWDRDVHDPMLLYGMDVVVKRVFEAIEKKEPILVYGDYDVDGITSTVILSDTLRFLGADVTPFLPHRVDNGYGLDGDVLKSLAKAVSLVITVDCGVCNNEEIGWLMERGIDVIVTDHHQMPAALPPAIAVIHPAHPEGSYPFHGLSGAGVAYKFAQALLRGAGLDEGERQEKEVELLDLVCLGTVADMMPMIGENRAIVVFGFEVLAKSRRPGVRAMIMAEGAGLVINEEFLGFRIIPMMNAAGRLEHPQIAMDLLMSQSNDEAQKHLVALKKLNRQRQMWSKKIISEAEATIQIADPIVFAHDESWPAGVVGLAAGRLSEKYGRPAFVMGTGKNGITGSARSPVGGNLVGLLEKCNDCLVKYGGHALAAGFSVNAEKLNVLREKLSLASDVISEEVAVEKVADAVTAPNILNRALTRLIDRMRPFGTNNGQPTFIAKNVYLADWRIVGKTGEHVKFAFNINGNLMDGIGFKMIDVMKGSRIAGGEEVDVLFKIEVDSYRGSEKLQLKVEDIARAGFVDIRK